MSEALDGMVVGLAGPASRSSQLEEPAGRARETTSGKHPQHNSQGTQQCSERYMEEDMSDGQAKTTQYGGRPSGVADGIGGATPALAYEPPALVRVGKLSELTQLSGWGSAWQPTYQPSPSSCA